MKKFIPIILSAVILAGCSGNSGGGEISDTVISEASETTAVTETETEKVSETTTTATVSETASETASVTTTVVTEELPENEELGVNSDGTLNEFFTEKITRLAEQNKPDHGLVYPALWDFDGDGVPEIILTHHNSGQGLMPSYVYSAESMEQIGEFDGFCRDGFTWFINTDEGTVIYNYYEHSEHQRVETVEQVGIKDGKLVSESLKKRAWFIAWGDNYPHHMEFSEEYSDADERDYSDRTAEYYRGNVCTSYNNKTYGDIKNVSENAAESYNNYIKAQALAKEDTDRVILAGEKNQYIFLQNKEGFYFIDEKGEKTVIKEGWAYYDFYRLGGNMIVSNDPGNLAVCDIYVISDGKPRLITELSGKGMLFDYSHFYNGGFELTHSTYDGMCTDDGGGGMHTFKKYQFYPTKDGFREYGSIVVPMDEFMEIYGDDIKPIADELAKEDTKIYEVLYRGDCCFILNCRETIFLDEEKTQPTGEYYTKNITLKPLYDGGFSELCRDTGVYRTALIPEIAVYPEKYYTKDEE